MSNRYFYFQSHKKSEFKEAKNTPRHFHKNLIRHVTGFIPCLLDATLERELDAGALVHLRVDGVVVVGVWRKLNFAIANKLRLEQGSRAGKRLVQDVSHFMRIGRRLKLFFFIKKTSTWPYSLPGHFIRPVVNKPYNKQRL